MTTPAEGGLVQQPFGMGIPPLAGTVGGLGIEGDLRRDEASPLPGGDDEPA